MSKEKEKQKYQAVFFDFDGVILDSVDVKTRAFATLFRPYGPEIEKAAVNYHLANGGFSRFEKFEYIFKYFIKKPVSKQELKELGTKFSNIALNRVLNSKFIPGAFETLIKLKEKNIPCFVISGTPDGEIKYIIQKRGLSDYFKEVHGSPKGKVEILADILVRFSYKKTDCLFIGDALSDYEAAKVIGINFIGIAVEPGKSVFPVGTKILINLIELS
jgi:HAD superfamily hydrolase (TIGR01549 family)